MDQISLNSQNVSLPVVQPQMPFLPLPLYQQNNAEDQLEEEEPSCGCCGTIINFLCDLFDCILIFFFGTEEDQLLDALVHEKFDRAATILDSKELDINSATDKGETPLILAARLGKQELLYEILKFKNVDVNAVDVDGKTALVHAIEKDNYQITERLLGMEGIKINTGIHPVYKTALNLALILKHFTLVNLILLSDKFDAVDINTKSYSMSPLILAVHEGRVKLVKMLLAFDNIDIYAKNIHDQTASDLAPNDEIKGLLTDHIAKLEEKRKADTDAFVAAINNVDYEKASQILDNGNVDINVRIDDTPCIIYALERNHLPLVLKLLTLDGLDPNAKDKKGATILRHIMTSRNIELIRTFLRTFLPRTGIADIDINAKDKDGKTALHWAAEKQATPDEVGVLVTLATLADKAIDINAKDNQDRTALAIAAEKGYHTLCFKLATVEGADTTVLIDQKKKELIGFIFDKYATDLEPYKDIEFLVEGDQIWITFTYNNENCKVTPHMLAVMTENLDCVKEILRFNGLKDINAQDGKGDHVLHYAISRSAAVFKELLSVPGIDLNVQGANGYTPLHIGCLNSYASNVLELCKMPELDFTIKDSAGYTAFALGRGEHTGRSSVRSEEASRTV